MTNANLVNRSKKFTFLELYAGDFPRVTIEVVAGTTDLVAGSVVKLTAGTVSLVNATTDIIHGILAHDIDAGQTGTAYMTGAFPGMYLTFGAAITDWKTMRPEARKHSIFLKETYTEV
jgi:hypothetical protein